MYERYHDRGGEPGQIRPDPPLPRRSVNAVLALQRATGNQGTVRVLAREKAKNRPSFEHSVKIGKFGPIEITGGNIGDWAAKKDPDGLKVISVTGKHSDELKRLHEGKARIDTVETASVVGENSLVTITFKNCRIRRYSTDGDKDEWTVEFESAKRQTLSIGAPRR
ncbi:MAG: hypothetical protein ACRDPC_07865 [Solirubrobacteraceae bacterium]